MGVEYYECRVCRECYPDCGDVEIRNCEKCHENICSNCLDKFLKDKKIKYWCHSEPALENEDEYLLVEFCPLCSEQTTNTEGDDNGK